LAAPKTVGIVYNPISPEAVLMAKKIRDDLCPVGNAWIEEIGSDGGLKSNMCKTDMLITVGGDGTILRAARSVVGQAIPILGINLGRLGFMTELRSEDAFERIPHFLEGGGWTEQRSTLEVMVSRNGRPITLGDTEFQIALNDVVLARGAKPRLMRAKAFVDGAEFTSYRADAVIISSATGSTGYNLAVGGPILHPTAEEMILKPVAPHVGLATAVVLPATSEVELLIQSDHDSVLSVDGFIEFPLQIEDVIKVKHSEQSVSFIREGSRRTFYATLMRRLGFESGIGSGRAIFY
tara:strand:- start:1127 stop:2008 length:882 start_codon:yes stop_codon:yes gene_type:complete